MSRCLRISLFNRDSYPFPRKCFLTIQNETNLREVRRSEDFDKQRRMLVTVCVCMKKIGYSQASSAMVGRGTSIGLFSGNWDDFELYL